MNSSTKKSKVSGRLSANKPFLLTSLAVIGSLVLALFEYIGLTSDSMSTLYKAGIGIGVIIICLGYLKASRGSWKALPLCLIFGVYIFTGSFSGRTTVTVKEEKAAQQIEQSQQNKQRLIGRLDEAMELAIEHKTIKSNNELFTTAKEIISSPSEVAITTSERRSSAVALLSQFGIHTTAEAFETFISALFTLSLFIAVGVLGKAGKVSGISREGQESEGDQVLTNPDIEHQENKTTFTDEEIERAFDWDIAANERKTYTNTLGHSAIKTFYKTEKSAGNDRVAALVKKKKLEIKEMLKEGGTTSRLGWKIHKGGKK